ncbi:hypothetical protein EMPS_04499 [Entomortierella parvispora]|uniref:Uncharacterized protein n=1 Tax=Entomortierella parvispora TaxID=205924 RepID=A0A9P3LVL0_9FUNG|nr:hypothetical protein EMPS_04499 [Entomortierella parvispora]
MARTATAATTTTMTHAAAAATATTPPSSTAMVYSYSSQGHLHPSSLVEFTRSRTDSTSSLSSLTATISSALNNTHSPPMALEDLSKIQRDLESLRQRRQQVREEQEQEEQEQDDMDDDDDDEQQQEENSPEKGQERGHERNRGDVVWHPSSPSQKPRAREKERNQCRLEHDLLQARKVLDGMQADYSVARSITQQYQFWVLSTHSQVAAAKQTLVRALEQQQQQQEQKDHQIEDKAHRSVVTCEDECCTSPELARTMTTSANTTATTATATTIKTVPCASGQEMQSDPHRHSLTYSSSSSVSTASSPRSSLSSVSMAELCEEENELFSCLNCYHDSPTTAQHQEHSKRVKVKVEETETVEDDAQTQQPHSHARPHSLSLISQKHQQQQQHQHRQQQQGVDDVGELWIKHLEREHSDLGNQLSLLLQEKAEAEEIKKEWADRLVWTKNRIKGFESALSEMKS